VYFSDELSFGYDGTEAGLMAKVEIVLFVTLCLLVHGVTTFSGLFAFAHWTAKQ